MTKQSDVNPQVLTAKTLIGDKVRNEQGENLGEIQDLMIDLDRGCIAYAVLSFGGILGMGDKLFAVPWQALDLQPEEHMFVLNVDKETLKNAPGFDKNNWPTTANREWMTAGPGNLSHQGMPFLGGKEAARPRGDRAPRGEIAC